MKKLVIAVLAVLFVAPAAFAEGWGVGVKLGAGENDPKDMEAAYDSWLSNKELDKDPTIASFEVFHEWTLDNEANKLGLKLGFDMYGQNEAERKNVPSLELTETTYAFPLTVYYKRDNGIKDWSWFAGAGVTSISTEIEAKGAFKRKIDKTKIFPHIVAGGEYRFNHLFALGLEARYNFAAKVKKDGDVLSDRSGFGAALTGRFYF